MKNTQNNAIENSHAKTMYNKNNYKKDTTAPKINNANAITLISLVITKLVPTA